MEEKDYRLVLVGNTQVGLMGLKGIFEELRAQRGMDESGRRPLDNHDRDKSMTEEDEGDG